MINLFQERFWYFRIRWAGSVGAYVIYRLKKNGKAPKAIINQNSDIITASGCALAGIPLFDLPENDISELKDSKEIIVDSNKSELKIEP